MKVAKFGGTSMASAERFATVAKRVLCDKDVKAVVVSAGGKIDGEIKVTDELLSAYNRIKSGESEEKSLAGFSRRILELGEKIRTKTDVIKELREIGRGLLKADRPDFILSRGEYLYSKLFAEYVGMKFIDAADVIKFYDDGKLNLGYTEYLADVARKKYGSFVTGGFYGSTVGGEIRVFPRGGGDMSGAIIARGIKADEYHNFTDVDGICRIDPKIAGKEYLIDEISFSEVRRLAEFGAGVLHGDSVLPLFGTGARIIVRNTFSDSFCGTVVKENAAPTFCAAIRSGYKYVKARSFGGGYGLFAKSGRAVLIRSDADYAEAVCESDVFSGAETQSERDGISVLYATEKQGLRAVRRAEDVGLCVMTASGDGHYAAFPTEKTGETADILKGILRENF